MRVDCDWKTKPAGEFSFANINPILSMVITSLAMWSFQISIMILLEDHLGVLWVDRHFVDTLAILGQLIGEKICAYVFVVRCPALSPVIRTVATAC